MKNIFVITFLFISIGFAVTVELMIRKGKLKRVDTYSYKPLIRRSILHLYITVAISLLIYAFSKSIEVTISLGVFLLFCMISACALGLLHEYQTKRRGGRKE